jgi:hypothetical protein
MRSPKGSSSIVVRRAIGKGVPNFLAKNTGVILFPESILMVGSSTT